MKKILGIVARFFPLDALVIGFGIARREILPSSFNSIKLSLSKEGRKTLRESKKEMRKEIKDRPDLLFISRWFPRLYIFMALFMVLYVLMHFFYPGRIPVWQPDLIVGLASIAAAWMAGVFAVLIASIMITVKGE